MEKLLDAVANVVGLVSSEKVQAISNRIRWTDAKAAGALSGVVGTPAAARVVDQLVEAWKATSVDAQELALMLLAAGHTFTKAANQQSTELVWTGPTTPFVSARRTEQALLQVIHSSEHTLFITSFVAHNIATIVGALNAARERGVEVAMLLELSKDHGGGISFDAIGKMQMQIPDANFYVWREKVDPFTNGVVHAKVAVADGRMCFITSANLTGHAMEKNMEAGVLISGGPLPKVLAEHLRALVDTQVIECINSQAGI